MENSIKDHLMQHLIINNFLTPCHHGFVTGRSCITQLLGCLDIWTDVIDKGGSVDVVYMDYANGFDKVARTRLLKKLRGYGVSSQILNWTRIFLTGRRQKVTVNGLESE